MTQAHPIQSPVAHERGRLLVTTEQGGPELLDRHADQWRALCDRAQPEMAFMRPEICAAYFRAFASKDPVVLITAWRNQELVAVWPMREVSAGRGAFRVHWLRSAINDCFPRFDVLHSGEDPDELAGALWREISRSYRRHMVHVDRALSGGVIDRMRAFAAAEGRMTQVSALDEAPYIAVPAPGTTVEAIIAAQGKSLRSSLRRGLRRLQERGQLRLLSAPGEGDGQPIIDWVDRYCELEHRGWKGRASVSINSNREARRFYDSLALDERSRRYFRCLALMFDDTMIAGDLGLYVDGTFFSMEITMDEKYREYSPGHLIQLFELVEFARTGGREIDLGGKADAYKMFWTASTRPYSTVFIFPVGIWGRAMRFMVHARNLRSEFAGTLHRQLPVRSKVNNAVSRFVVAVGSLNRGRVVYGRKG